MKKFKNPSIFLFIFSIGISINSNRSNYSSNLTLENIEALASTENNEAACWDIGSIDCPYSKDKVKSVF
ncbi:MAG: NVEALA domain-containing protein [Bacteroidales bacterium]|nr:NVEALA domain-containing protein [Bacteroidales bacterium]